MTRRGKRRTRGTKRRKRRELVENLYKVGQFFAAVFIVLLLIAAIALAKGYEKDANQAAEYAYYSLVIGVVFLLAATILEEKNDQILG
ncbi:hypothetical protein [Pyrofollis japonicus]|uniref:hypothetical protein n=1 Tax=Pyrofollis japonicus TaxID=3060460 RepID=UPI00295BBD03|nr:hypothetical protein [Pyrofollis japonicus]